MISRCSSVQLLFIECELCIRRHEESRPGTVTKAKFLDSIKFIFILNGGGWKILNMLGKKKDPGDEVL